MAGGIHLVKHICLPLATLLSELPANEDKAESCCEYKQLFEKELYHYESLARICKAVCKSMVMSPTAKK